MSQIKSLFYMILFDSQQFRELFGLAWIIHESDSGKDESGAVIPETSYFTQRSVNHSG